MAADRFAYEVVGSLLPMPADGLTVWAIPTKLVGVANGAFGILASSRLAEQGNPGSNYVGVNTFTKPQYWCEKI
ncbi:hypothetical protein LP7551_04729 [Roseibium album]|nr:hypothetical protein LP7551_04729 [Roseibium album]